jgi:hypothetical protein
MCAQFQDLEPALCWQKVHRNRREVRQREVEGKVKALQRLARNGGATPQVMAALDRAFRRLYRLRMKG